MGEEGDANEQRGRLVAAAAAGDETAMQQLVTELVPRVRNLVRYLVRGDEEADDVAHDALVVLMERLDTFRGDGRFEAWVDGVVTRVALGAVRRRRRRLVRSAPQEASEVPVPSTAAGRDPLARRRMVLALDQLPDKQRHALVLHHVLGMSVPEVASELSVPRETVRSRLRLGMSALRTSMPSSPEGQGS
jgi:RNA polymerase sigma-70 factor (ECF subfamily)